MHRRRYLTHLFRDFLIVAGSIVVSVVLVKGNLIQSFIEATSDFKILSSVIAGAFFTSVFTLAPASVGLIAISKSFPPVLVAFFAALGAMTIDMLIASFVRKDLAQDLDGLAKMTLRRHFIKAFHFGFLKWVAFIFGMLFIATPLPDEFGLFLIGISKVKSWVLPFIFFLAHFGGILLLLSIAGHI